MASLRSASSRVQFLKNRGRSEAPSTYFVCVSVQNKAFVFGLE